MLSRVMIAQGVYLAFDFGTKHIGVAVGQTVTQTTNPLATLQAYQGKPQWQEIADIIEQWHPKGLVVGMTLQLDGSQTPTSRLAQ